MRTTLRRFCSKLSSWSAIHYQDIPQGPGAKIHAYAKRTPWSTTVLNQLPTFYARAREMFGDDIPAIDMYIFARRNEYNLFFKTMFWGHTPGSWQDGTGDASLVIFCEQDKDGKPVLPMMRATANTLHEYGHALCSTIFGDNYLNTVPQWFDEDTADALAMPFNESLYKESRRLLINDARAGVPLPTYAQMSKEVYKDPSRRYACARLMVLELLRGRRLSTIRLILNRAREIQNFETAISQVTAINPPDLLKRIR